MNALGKEWASGEFQELAKAASFLGVQNIINTFNMMTFLEFIKFLVGIMNECFEIA